MSDYREIVWNYHNPNDNHLYQTNPWPNEPPKPFTWGKNRSWTSSLESYASAAQKESYCLLHNGHRANFTLQLNLLGIYFVHDIEKLRSELKKLFACLSRKKNISAYAALEVTRNKFKTGPTDRIHIHFLIDTKLTEIELIDLFHRACKSAKFTTDDYRISKVDNIAGISDGEYKHRICNYIVKDGFPEKVIMFKTMKPRFNKIRTVGKFWTDKDGKPTQKDKIWMKASLKEWKRIADGFDG